MSIKDEKQKEALDAIRGKPRSILVAATGFGKSKVAIDRAREVVKKNADARIIISVPTEKLRDENWMEEFIKWGAADIWYNNVVRSCYVSMNKLNKEHYDFHIMDEGHNITESNALFFAQNDVDEVLLLTATFPEDKAKQLILKELGFKKEFEMTLDEAVKLGLVSPYEITIVEVDLDNKDKYITAGSKDKPFMQTEAGQYKYLSDVIRRLMFSNRPQDKKQVNFKILDRMRFIYNLRTKTKVAKYLLENVIPKDKRTLIFSGSIDQAEILCENSFHSKSKDSSGLDKFKAREINRLSCVEALNEGQNIEEVHYALIAQLNSKALDLIQRIGRIIRFKDGHTGKVFIIGVLGTKDMDWIKTALENFDPSKIRYVRYENLISGNEKL